MKKLFKIASMLIALNSFAQNNLVVFSENGEKFYLLVNGVKQNVTPETNVKVTDLIHPQYKVKVMFEEKAKGIIDQTVYMMDGGENVKNHEFVYNVKMTKKGEYKIRPLSAVAISESKADPSQAVVHYSTSEPVQNSSSNPASTQVNTQVSHNAAANVHVTETSTQSQLNGENGNTANVGVNINGMGVNISISDNNGGMNHSSSTTVTSKTVTSSGTYMTHAPDHINEEPVANPGTGSVKGNSPSNCTRPMNAAEFTSVKSSIESKNFEESKIKVAKQVIDANCLTTDQVKQIMLSFSFEETRLDLAKYAYLHTYDPKNYFKLNDAFTFETSIDELDAYIKSKK
jgi:hypothetical protein